MVVLTGAGISTGSGIPDFRGPQGVWTRDPGAMRLLDWTAYRSDPEVRVAAWRMWRDHPVWHATPSRAHLALVDLERAGLLRAVCTQNFDGLHQRAGQDPALVHELHGSLPGSTCRDCGAREATADVLARLDDDPDPHCRACGGTLATDVVMFGEALPADALDAGIRAAQDCALFVAIGTTLTVQPAAALTAVAADCRGERGDRQRRPDALRRARRRGGPRPHRRRGACARRRARRVRRARRRPGCRPRGGPGCGRMRTCASTSPPTTPGSS